MPANSWPKSVISDAPICVKSLLIISVASLAFWFCGTAFIAEPIFGNWFASIAITLGLLATLGRPKESRAPVTIALGSPWPPKPPTTPPVPARPIVLVNPIGSVPVPKYFCVAAISLKEYNFPSSWPISFNDLPASSTSPALSAAFLTIFT